MIFLDDGIYLGTDHGEIIVLRRPAADEEGLVRFSFPHFALQLIHFG
jgi:hypothetical protein